MIDQFEVIVVHKDQGARKTKRKRKKSDLPSDFLLKMLNCYVRAWSYNSKED